jgi:gamma-glutamyltranspeptidase/glutathione hydrolase
MDNMVVCPEPPAAGVGQRIFAQGGNAVDCAVATAFTQAVTNPLLCGLGGTGLWNYYDAQSGKNIIFNSEVSIGSLPAPESWVSEFKGRSETIGRYIISSEANQAGYQSVMTPGFVRGCWEIFQLYGSGRLTWAELLAPSVRIAREGFEIYPYIAAFWQEKASRAGYPGLISKLHASRDAARIYLKPDGSVYQLGDRLVQAELAQTIERLAEAGGDDFYNGDIARQLSEDFDKNQAFITEQDLRDYSVKHEQPLESQYRGAKVSATSYSGGAQVILMLNVLGHFDLPSLGHNTPAYIDFFSRIQRATFADSAKLKGLGAEEAEELQQEMISPKRAAYWAKRISEGDRIVVSASPTDSGTTHLTCIDASRNVVSFTHSIGSIAGSGVITPGLGFLHNNFLGHFHPLPGKPDSIRPGKRLSGVAPTILFKDKQPYIAIGAPGGSRIITALVESIANVVDYGMDMRTAVTVPRFHSEEGQKLFLEPQFTQQTVDSLLDKGNEVQWSTYMSRVQAILVRSDTQTLEAGADPRGGAGIGRYPITPAIFMSHAVI